MRIEKKVWGERWMIREDSVHTTNILNLVKGNRCSWHYHQQKYNLFAVITGKIRIVRGIPETNHRISCDLIAGDTFIVSPGIWHEFQVIESGIIVEEMYVQYDDEDIEREKLGGPIDE